MTAKRPFGQLDLSKPIHQRTEHYYEWRARMEAEGQEEGPLSDECLTYWAWKVYNAWKGGSKIEPSGRGGGEVLSTT